VGSTNIAPTFLNVVAVQPYASAALSPQKGMTATHLIGGWFGQKTSVDILEDRNVLDVHLTVHRVKFLIISPTRCTNFSNLFLE
jgi:hypothetical protein